MSLKKYAKVLIPAFVLLIVGIMFFAFANSKQTNSERKVAESKTSSSEEKSKVQDRKLEYQGDTTEALEYFRKEKEKEDRTLLLLKKYYGEDEINRIAEKIKSEAKDDYESEGKYQYQESVKELLEKMLALIESEDISEADKQDLIDVISKIEIGYLDDDELKNRIEEYRK